MGFDRGISGSSNWAWTVLLMTTSLLLYGPSEISAQGNATYAVLAPQNLRAGWAYTMSVTLVNASSPVTFTAYLQDPTTTNVTLASGSVVLSLGPKGAANTSSLSLQIPSLVPQTSYLLVVNGSGGLSFSENHTVGVSGKTLSIFVQTDKAMYQPGQTVLIRAIVVLPTLLPYKGLMNISIFDNMGNKIYQWLNMQNNTGVVGQQLQLAAEANLGSWICQVDASGNTLQKTFTVATYVLPKFDVTVTLPSYYFVNLNQKSLQKNLPITITAKYTYGEPVQGTVNISVQIAPYSQ